VIWLHVSASVVHTIPNIYFISWWVANFADAFSRWCVPVFVMVSGALLLSSPSKLTPIQFYRRRAARLLPPIIVWTLVFILFRKYTEANFNSIVALESIVSGRPYIHLWYLYMVVGLYIITPFLRSLVTVLDADSLRLLMLFCFAISAIECTRDVSSSTFLAGFLPFIGYFLAGYYFFCCQNKPNVWRSIFIILACGLAIAVGTGVLLSLYGASSLEIMYSNQNPIVVVMSICIFRLLLAQDSNSFVTTDFFQRISGVMLGVYTIHPLWLWVLSKFGIDGFLVNPLIGIPVTTFLAFSLSLLLAALMSSVPYLRRIVC
jgi:surface polysaccharide O-acyltransferase-like enzyme